MIIIDPVAMGDVSFSRASPKCVFDRTGTLVEVPPDTLAITYDPADLSKAPYAHVEQEGSNRLFYSEQFGNAVWGRLNAWVDPDVAISPRGTMGATKIVESANAGFHEIRQSCFIEPGTRATISVFAKAAERSRIRLAGFASSQWATFPQAIFDLTTGTVFSGSGTIESVGGGWYRCSVSSEVNAAGTGVVGAVYSPVETTTNNYTGDGASGVLIFGAMLCPGALSSYIPTLATAVTRAADVVGPGAGLVYSNVPITEQVYNAATTYAKDAVVYNPATHLTHRSMVDANKGGALTDLSKWTKGIATNRWKMFDELNNTQTERADEIVVVVTPEVISEGFYIGNVQADEIQLSQADALEGPVLRETASLVESSGGSSYYDWCFRPPYYKDYFITQSMLPYGGGLVTLVLRRLGGIAKCGMCMVGPVDDFGPSLYGLSAEGTDYSSTVFEFDGTSETTFRPYAKRMSVDVQVDNSQIDYIQQRLFDRRQRMLVWIGGPFGATAVCGRYESFKIVIPGLLKSDMALQIGGGV